jgi:hypothetical protein
MPANVTSLPSFKKFLDSKAKESRRRSVLESGEIEMVGHAVASKSAAWLHPERKRLLGGV